MKRSRVVGGVEGRSGSAAQPSIRNYFSTTKAGQQQKDDDNQNSKRRKQGSGDSPCVIVLDDADEEGAVGAVEQATAATSTQQPARAAVHSRAVPNQRDAAAHGKAQAKLVAVRGDDEADGTEQQQQLQAARAAGRQAPAPKYTPLVCSPSYTSGLLPPCCISCMPPPSPPPSCNPHHAASPSLGIKIAQYFGLLALLSYGAAWLCMCMLLAAFCHCKRSLCRVCVTAGAAGCGAETAAPRCAAAGGGGLQDAHVWTRC
jgi:hypothetical protein